MFGAGPQPQADDGVEYDGRQRHADHKAGPDRLRRPKAPDRLPKDDEGDHHQRRGVDQGGQDADAMVAVGPLGVGRPTGDPNGVPGETQSQSVCEVVARVGKQSHAVGEVAGDRLARHESQREGDGQSRKCAPPPRR